MSTTPFKKLVLASSGLLAASIFAAPASFAQSTTAMTDFTPPALIKQNIGPVETSLTAAEAIEDILTLGTIESLLDMTGLDDTISSDSYTIFAPRDSSFWQVAGSDYKRLMEDDAYAKDVLLSHVVAGNLNSSALISEITGSDTATAMRETVNGKTLTFAMEGGFVTVMDENGNKAQVTRADIAVENGQIHIINGVMSVTNEDTGTNFS